MQKDAASDENDAKDDAIDAIDIVMGRREDKTLDLVREIGFDQLLGLDRIEERIFFIGPVLQAERERGAHATEAAVLEFIAYWENQIEVARDYLAHGRENRTHRWKKKSER
jgi:hypothetical protein